MGKIIIIVAPSGTGKSTLIKHLKRDFPQLEESVSYTTRPQRSGELDGVNYFFISLDQFEKMRDQGEFLEWAKVHSNYYGTSREFVEKKIKDNAVLLFDLDVQGADAIGAAYPEVTTSIFIEPPSLEALERRLKKRGTDSSDVIQERIQNARRELERKADYDFLVTNDHYENAFLELSEIFKKVIAKS